ncbi:Cyclin N-terminal domain-containing protein [Heracleum sosnowskyi]|uniref:Cyclin N-terminal domain-containing protein n=1 Tax=Heracleum sosnowskyi TaxID=360622 RepID=A0AAD8MBF7_9APIA|nr:Cyclin N-terminal domain-containing protein [Heracleum sosnowskyi]
MASRPFVEQNRAEEAGGGGALKQKNMAAGEGRNRRALGDIGNLVTVHGIEGKQQQIPQVSRPVTRGFCAQLLANAQEAAVENNKKQRAAEKKVTVKPKPEDIIVISPDTEEVDRVNKHLNRKKANEGSSKKKGQTFSSTLTARSKAAGFGLSGKPKEQIVDIDAADANNELAAVEYVEDMYKFYKSAEHESRVFDYIDFQPEINQKMRAILVDWLVEVHNKFELMPETLYLTINILDRYLSTKSVARKELQLASIPNEPAVENMAYFLAELGMMNYATVTYCPSMVAACAVYGARCTLDKAPFWNETLRLHSSFSEHQLMECARALVRFHSCAAENKLRVIYKKYSDAERGCVAMLPPAKALLSNFRTE